MNRLMGNLDSHILPSDKGLTNKVEQCKLGKNKL